MGIWFHYPRMSLRVFCMKGAFVSVMGKKMFALYVLSAAGNTF